jgi:carbamate kinase
MWRSCTGTARRSARSPSSRRWRPRIVPAQPLFALDAMTEAQLVSLIALALGRVSHGRVEAVCVVTHTVVSLDDEAFACPTKPIGPFFDEARATEPMVERGRVMREDAGAAPARSSRRQSRCRSSSPRLSSRSSAPGRSLSLRAAGGIPVVADEDGYIGVDAVVDKDLAAERLAPTLGAEDLLMVTGVERVCLDFGTPAERGIEVMTAGEAQRHLAQRQFAAGSMGSMVRAGVHFLANGAGRVVITTPELVVQAMRAEGRAVGTIIVPDGDRL